MNSSELQLKKIKETLENCYRNLPDQFALTEVKGNLRKTIDSIQFVEKKRNTVDESFILCFNETRTHKKQVKE